MSSVFDVARYLVKYALAAHEDEIAIIAYYGSYAKGQATATSDLDIFYIPDTGKADDLAVQFVLEGRPYDFWPVSWSMAEDIAEAQSTRPWAVSASLIADAKIIYYRTEADLERFSALQQQIQVLTRPNKRQLMAKRAQDSFEALLLELGRLKLATDKGRSDFYAVSWDFLTAALNTLALVNQTYSGKGWGSNHAELMRMKIVPADLDDRVRALLFAPTTEAGLETAVLLSEEISQILATILTDKRNRAGAVQELNGFYYYVIEYVHKIKSACRRKDLLAAGYAAYQLQDLFSRLLHEAVDEPVPLSHAFPSSYGGIYYKAGFPDLCSLAAAGNLDTLARKAEELDLLARDWFNKHNVPINVIDNEANLKRFLAMQKAANPSNEHNTA